LGAPALRVLDEQAGDQPGLKEEGPDRAEDVPAVPHPQRRLVEQDAAVRRNTARIESPASELARVEHGHVGADVGWSRALAGQHAEGQLGGDVAGGLEAHHVAPDRARAEGIVREGVDGSAGRGGDLPDHLRGPRVPPRRIAEEYPDEDDGALRKSPDPGENVLETEIADMDDLHRPAD